jgi:hypothetical protein
MGLTLLWRAVSRHSKMKNWLAYERVIREVAAMDDVWAVSQGEYIAWWQRRAEANLTLTVANGQCLAETDLEGGVLERFAGHFLEGNRASIPCPAARFAGRVTWVVDPSLRQRELLWEILTREGIRNLCLGSEQDNEEPPWWLSHELDPLLDQMGGSLQPPRWEAFEAGVEALRQELVARLESRGLPLIRLWYHPRRSGHVVRVVFSPRFDVDRAITTMLHIWGLEKRYGVTSTAYVRPFCPFYAEEDIRCLAGQSRKHEIALHGEFVHHANEFGSERAAAQVEKARLEAIIGRPVTGVSLHGGELFANAHQRIWPIIEETGFVYDTAHGPLPYYLPYRLLTADGSLEKTYRLRYHFRDIGVSRDGDFEANFYNDAMRVLDEVRDHGGVMVLLLHPEYYGFRSYLARPGNLFRLFRFLPIYLGRILRVRK